MQKDLLSVKDLTIKELEELIKLAVAIKRSPDKYRSALSGKTIIMIFERPSTRTRVSFECAMLQLGGNSVNITKNTSQLNRGETPADSARVLERYVDGIVARVESHQTLVEFKDNARIPVINALSEIEHPCQVLADLETVYEIKNKLSGVKMAYVGDGNNVCNSLLLGCAMTGMSLSVATPDKYMPRQENIDAAVEIAKKTGSIIEVTKDPIKAVRDADFVYTDVWVSMGQESEEKEKIKLFREYQINKSLMSHAKKDAKVMHCLPAHRDMEVSSEAIDGPQSIVWDQAENRLHMQKAILVKMLQKK